jgi:hypothetical protein
MHRATANLMKRIRKAFLLKKKMAVLENAYAGETAYVLTCGPSINAFWNPPVRAFLNDKLVMAVKQTYDLGPEVCDFHILNSWNYTPYQYTEPRPIVIGERGPNDPKTPGMRPDLMFSVPAPNNFEQRLATTWHYDEWLFSKTFDRPWGPGVMYELCFPLLVHLGVKEIVTLGWDLGERNAPNMEHFFHEEPSGSEKSDGIVNKPRIRSFEVGDIAKSTKALYYWLRAKGIYLHIVSDRSLVDEVVPRITTLDAPRRRWVYETEVVGNGGFSAWYGDAPKMWTPEPDASAARPTRETPGGLTGVQLLPPKGSDCNRVTQTIQLEPFFSGAGICARMEACAHERGKCSLVVTVQPKGRAEPLVFSSDHPGDGQWHRITVEAEIPAGVNPQLLKIAVQLRAGATQPASATQVETILRK